MKPRVLVVGGAGYIGGCVTDLLKERGLSFCVYDNLTYEKHYLKPVPFIYGDVREKEKLKRIFPDYTHIVWLAAIVGDGACEIKPEFTREVNQEAVEWLSKNFNGRIVFTSTCSVYGVSDEPVSETSLTQPLSVYAKTKLEAEKKLKGKNAIIFRLGTAFGVSDSYARIRMDLAINYMTMKALTKKKLNVFGGKQWRPFVHVKEIGKTIANSVILPHTGIYNLATENLTILDAAKKIQKLTKCRIVISDQNFQDNRNYHADTTKIHREKIISDRTHYDVCFGIKEIKDLVLSNRINDLENEVYSNQKYLLKAIEKYRDEWNRIYLNRRKSYG